MILILALDAFEDLDRLIYRRLFHANRLKSSFKRGVAFQILAILVRSGCADGLQFAPGKGRLQDVGGVNGAFGGARAHHSMHFVYEQDAVAGLRYLFDDLLEALLEFAAILCAGDQRAHIEGYQTLAAQCRGNFVGGDHLSESFHNRRLANARLAHQNRVVLGAAAEYLGNALNFVASAHSGVKLIVFRFFG